MKVSQKDKRYLLSAYNFFDNRDLEQIERQAAEVRYYYNDKRISRKEAINLLGREKFLSGLGRCVFHWDAVRLTPTGEEVYFDITQSYLRKCYARR